MKAFIKGCAVGLAMIVGSVVAVLGCSLVEQGMGPLWAMGYAAVMFILSMGFLAWLFEPPTKGRERA